MDERTYICTDPHCETWFTVHNALWSEDSLNCPLCGSSVMKERVEE